MELTHVNFGFCNMSGKLFVLANRKGYDSELFIESLMNSEVGEHLYHSPYTDLWIGETYIMAVLEDETPIRKGKCLSDDFMYWAGYLFKVWNLTYPEETAKEMLMQAPPTTLKQMFCGLHVMSYEQAILELKDLYKVRNCREITCASDLSQCPSAASENLDAAHCACDFLLCR